MSGRGRAFYSELLASSGVWMAGTAVLVFLLMLATLFGPFEIFQGRDQGPKGFPPRIALWFPPSTPVAEVTRARQLWREVGPRETEWMESSSLSDLAASEPDVVLLPRARRLSGSEARELERHVSSGGAVVVTGAVAVRDAQGEWRGWETMASLLKVDRIVPQPRDRSTYFEATAQSGAFTGLRPGQRVNVVPEEGVPAVVGEGAPLVWALGGAKEPRWGAMRTVERGKGRLLWLAAGPEYSVDAESAKALGQLARAALAWAGRLPNATLADESGTNLELRRVGPKRVEVALHNPGKEETAAVDVQVYLHTPIGRAALRATKVFQETRPDGRIEFEPGTSQLRLILPPVAAGARESWNLEWSESAADQTAANGSNDGK